MPGQLHLPVLHPPDAPKTRGDCVGGERPCRWTSCRYHLWAVDAQDRPGRRWAFESRAAKVRQHSEVSCALDVADANPDGIGRRAVRGMLGLKAEQLRQVEITATRRLKMAIAWEHHETGDCLAGCVWCVLDELSEM